MLPLLSFYQTRLPIYYRIRTVIEVLLMVSAALTTFLGFCNLQGWAPVVAAVTGATMAWLEFSGTSKKLSRYTDVVHQVCESVLTTYTPGYAQVPKVHLMLARPRLTALIHLFLAGEHRGLVVELSDPS